MDKRYSKLLNHWSPPKDSGDAIGFIATTFTFNSSFFDEECLSRFLVIKTDQDSDGILYVIEREEKLRKLQCASIWVDNSNCKSVRSVSWDLMPVNVSGAFHPKISILYWANCIRIIVASANLTEEGYCRNQEVLGVFDFYPQMQEDKLNSPTSTLVNDIIKFMKKILGTYLQCSEKIYSKYDTLHTPTKLTSLRRFNLTTSRRCA